MEKQPFEWEEEDIQRLINNQIQESTNLEYKRCDALIENVEVWGQIFILDLTEFVASPAQSLPTDFDLFPAMHKASSS